MATETPQGFDLVTRLSLAKVDDHYDITPGSGGSEALIEGRNGKYFAAYMLDDYGLNMLAPLLLSSEDDQAAAEKILRSVSNKSPSCVIIPSNNGDKTDISAAESPSDICITCCDMFQDEPLHYESLLRGIDKLAERDDEIGRRARDYRNRSFVSIIEDLFYDESNFVRHISLDNVQTVSFDSCSVGVEVSVEHDNKRATIKLTSTTDATIIANGILASLEDVLYCFGIRLVKLDCDEVRIYDDMYVNVNDGSRIKAV